MEYPFVSIIIPTRNEEKFIEGCIDSILNNTYPKDRIEIIIIDGMSQDRTRQIIRNYLDKFNFIRFIENKYLSVPYALNKGIKESRGDIIIRMDAHCIYEKDYILNCVEYLIKEKVDNVGGILITLPFDDKFISHAIALALSSPFGVGNSYFRISTKNKRYVDTVPFGCFKKDLFNKIGLFDTSLNKNQDDEFNSRIIKNGGKILLAPDIKAYYFARNSLRELFQMYFQYGKYKPLVNKKTGKIITWRQLVPPAFIIILISILIGMVFDKIFLRFLFIILSMYFLTALCFSIDIVLKKKDYKGSILIIPAFISMHFGYGIGYLVGLLKLLSRKTD